MQHLKGKLWVVGLFFSVILILMSAAFFIFSVEMPNKIGNEEDLNEQANLWRWQIQNIGGDAAYEKLKVIYIDRTPQEGHNISHLFGDALYKHEGDEGLKVCDNNFAFGCYHGFLSAALTARGLEVVPELNEACMNKNGKSETGCRHGIGHGLLEYLGPEELEQALKICSSLQEVTSLGCTQGVFMEYNRPGLNTQFLGLRKLERQDDVYEPCASLPEMFKESCFYEQSQWWVGVFQKDYQKVGLLCKGLEVEGERENCFFGVGISAAERSGYDVGSTINNCNQMPEIEDQVDCRSAAVWVFEASQKYRDSAQSICKNLPDPYINVCLRNELR